MSPVPTPRVPRSNPASPPFRHPSPPFRNPRVPTLPTRESNAPEPRVQRSGLRHSRLERLTGRERGTRGTGRRGTRGSRTGDSRVLGVGLAGAWCWARGLGVLFAWGAKTVRGWPHAAASHRARPGQRHCRRPGRERGADRRRGRARAPSAARTLVVFPEMVLTGYPVEDLALRESFAQRSEQALTTLAAPAGRRGLRRDRRRGRATSTATRSGRATRSPCCTAARSSPRSSSTTCPTTACSTSAATSSRARRWTSCGIHGVEVGLVDLRGHLAGRRPDRRARRGRRRPGRRRPTPRPYERDKDDVRAAARGPPRGRGGRAAGLRQPGRRPGRPRVRRRLDGRRRRRVSCWPARRSSSSTCTVARPGPARRAPSRTARRRSASFTVHPHDAVTTIRCRPTTRSTSRGPPSRCPSSAEVWRALVARPARLRAQERLPLRRARPVRRHRLRGLRRARGRRARAPTTCTASRCRRSTRPTTPAPTPPTSPCAPGCTTRCSRSRDMVATFVDAARADRPRRGERAGPLPRHDPDGRCPTSTATWCSRTGNKTELAVGYSTIYGDAVGGFAPIKDVPKTLVWELARWRNERGGSAARPRRSRRTRSPSRRRRSCGPARSTPTRCRTTSCSTASWTTTSRATAATPTWSPPGSRRS